MSSLRLTRIRERLAAVPHRYGEVQRYDDSDGSINYQLTIGAHPDSLIWNLADDRAGRVAKATAELLANAPGDLALLLGELERVREMGGEAIALLTREVSRLEEQRDTLRVEVERLRRERDGEVWLWAGDGTDDTESLACPVLMSAEQVRELTGQVAELDEAAREAEQEADVLRAKVDELEAAAAREALELHAAATLLWAAADDIRQELWVEGDDPRGHAYYDRLTDILPPPDGVTDHVCPECGWQGPASTLVQKLSGTICPSCSVVVKWSGQARLQALEAAGPDPRALLDLIRERHLLECAEEMVGGAECSCTRRTTAALEEIRAFIAAPRPDSSDLLAELGEVRVRFGLDAQGHVPTIKRMLAEGADWQAIGAAINWDPATAQTHWSAREAKLREATEPKTLTLDDLRPLMVEGWEMPEAPEESLPRGPLRLGAIWVEGFGWDLRWCWADGVPTSHLIPDPFRDDVTCTAEMLQALGFTVEAG